MTAAKLPQVRPSAETTGYARKVTAARIRVNVDKQRGVVTPKWIRDLAGERKTR